MTHVSDRTTTAPWASIRVMLSPGELLVSRVGPAIVVADARTPGQEATADRVLALCAESARTGSAAGGEALVRSAAALLLAAGSEEVPALGLVTVTDDRLLVTLTTGMRIAVTDARGAVEVVDADGALLPVSHAVRGSAASVAVAPDPLSLQADRRSNLSGGVVRAGGLLLVPGAPLAPNEPAQETLVDLAATEPPGFETFSLVADEVGEEAGDASGETAGETEPAGPMVRGIICSRGHLNPPDARFCERCGISTVHQTHNLVTGPRPPLGVLVVDDGSVHSLVRDCVIGRDPASAEEVRAGGAAGLALEDAGLSLSRVHARLVLDGWEVRVVDAGSANGTFVADAGSDDWRRLEADLPTTITPGTRLRMGSRVLTFESHHRV